MSFSKTQSMAGPSADPTNKQSQNSNNTFKTLDIAKNQSVNIMKTGGASDFLMDKKINPEKSN
jgi:hypothetical protein